MPFSDLIRKRVQDGLRGAHAPDGPFLDVLHDLAEGLDSEKVRASVTRGPVPGRYYLTLWPSTVPARRQLMLAFWVTNHSIKVFADPAVEFRDPEKLMAWLADYVSQPELLESLEVLGEIAGQPVEAYLRARAAGEPDRQDVVVLVAPEVQRTLVSQPAGSAVDLVVAPATTRAAGTWDPAHQYAALDASGLTIDRISVTSNSDGTLRVQGLVRTESELQGAVKRHQRAVRARMTKKRAER